MGQTLSDYALHDGAGKLFAACVGCAAAGSAAVLAGLVRSRLSIGAVAPAVLGVGCAGLSLCAVFPTDPAGSVPSVNGLVHRHAAGPRWSHYPLQDCCWPAGSAATRPRVRGCGAYAACRMRVPRRR